MALLRTHIVGRAEYLTTPGHLGIQSHLFGQPEIDDCQSAVISEHDVAGFQIPVQNAYAVNLRDSTGKLLRVGDGITLVDAVRNLLFQIAARHVLHRDVRVIVTDTEIVNLHDASVLQPGNQFVLLEEPVKRTESVGQIGNLPENLQHDFQAR